MDDVSKLWIKTIEELKKYVDDERMEEIFKPLTKSIHRFADGVLYIMCPSAFCKNRILSIYYHRLDEIINNFSSSKIVLKFITEDETKEIGESKDKTHLARYTKANINPLYTFSNFVSGKSNFFAMRSAMMTAEELGANNPLYIFGNVGLGKTHLMHSIGNYVLDKDINAKVLYVSASVFLEDFHIMLKNNQIESFYDKYREVDCLLVDDIQILATAPKTQIEFFKLFEYLDNNHKQIVVTSDKPANDLTQIMDRLVSRFERGLIVDIGSPDLELRIKILKKKLELEYPENTKVSDEVLTFIASNFVSNVRELEGALKRVINYCFFNNLPFTQDVVLEALDSLLKSKKKIEDISQSSYSKIISIVADYYHLTSDDLISKSRKEAIVWPRHVAMYLIKKEHSITYTKIGEIFGGKDHSTVLSAIEKIDWEIKKNETFRKTLAIISKKINNPSKPF
ncbi:MAG: chromosomal replication initiator protein DnaA [Acholeplasmatales bacterium]|jgi:chromosomal replication initiator protein|nr:chromosomal replication initiator protein DnaA [Acholeplasmatales bacterium]